MEDLQKRLGIEEVEDAEFVDRVVDISRMELNIKLLNEKQQAVFNMIIDSISDQIAKGLPVHNAFSIALFISGTGKVLLNFLF